MSSIEKLAIRGIRGFSPYEEEKIEFFKPLTLLLGQNGAGKTSLRTMTSGSMPPHTNGGKTFIHDPRMSNQAETKASIKLKFNTIKNRPVFAMRSFQLTNRKQKQEFKKMEQVLKAKDEKTGQEISINKNCAEMDRQVPLLMGVSNAILENVIFCHQEDTLWPFSDQANLKKIFDEIFDTTKYTKALTEMRNTGKKYHKYSKEFKQELDLKKKDFELYAKMKFNINQYESKIKELKEAMVIKQQKRELLDKELRELENEERIIAKAENDNSFLTLRINEKSKEILEMESRLGFSSSDILEKEKELNDLKENYEQTMVKLCQREKQHTIKIEKLKERNMNLKLDQNKMQSDLTNQLRMLEESQNVKDKLVQKIITYTDQVRGGISISFKNKDIQPFELEAEKQRLKIQRESLEQDYNRLRKEREDQVNEKTQAVRVEEAKEAIYSKTLFDIEKQLNQLRENQRDSSDGNFEKIEQQINEIQKRIGDIRLTLSKDYGIMIAADSLEGGLTSNDDAIFSQQNQASSQSNRKSNAQLTKVQKLKNKIIGKRAKQQETQDKVRELKIKIVEHETDIKKEELKKQNFNQFSELVNKFEATRIKLNLQLDNLGIPMIKEKEYSRDFKSMIQQVNQKCSNKECLLYAIEEFKKLRNKFSQSQPLNSVNGQVPETVNLQIIKAKIEKIIRQESTMKSTMTTINRLIRLSNESQQCFFCKQQANQSVLQGIERNFQPTNDFEEHKRNLEQEKSQLNSMLQTFQTCTTHSNEQALKEIQSRITELSDQLTKANNTDSSQLAQQLLELDYLSKQITKYDQSIQNFDGENLIKLKGDLSSIVAQIGKQDLSLSKLNKEVEDMIKEKETMEYKQNQLQQEYLTLKAKNYKLISKSKRDTQSKGNQQSIEEEILKLSRQKTNNEVYIKEIHEKIRMHNQELKDINTDQGSNSDYNKLQEIQTQLHLMSQVLDVLSQYHLQLQNAQQQLDRYFITQKQRDDQELQILQLDNQLKQIDRELLDEEESLKMISMAIKNQSQIELTIAEFDKYKQLKTSVREAQIRVIENQKIMGNKDQLYVLKKSKIEEMNEAQNTYSKNTGILISLQDSLKNMRMDLSDEKFSDIEKRLLDLELKYNMTKFMALEVGEKHDALEESLMQYHHEKMKEINKTLSDFWKMTYKGNDIDTIEIKSDVEKSMNSRVRSFNYRIVLKTFDETELDMRGRCSAGQKVLSSIIIRLSLAETFCSNCGILALDEPTTNLDAENIEGLANALMEIIDSRKKQDNFQLIIITHDEQFVQLLGSTYTEYVWKVYKDEKSYSRIKKLGISNIL